MDWAKRKIIFLSDGSKQFKAKREFKINWDKRNGKTLTRLWAASWRKDYLKLRIIE